MLAPVALLLCSYAIIFLLHLAVPGRWVDGYVVDPRTQRPYRYHLNGLRVFLLTVALWAGACWQGWLGWDTLHAQSAGMAAAACVVGLVFSAAIVFPYPRVKGPLADFYLGRLDNPQALGGRVDAKMWLYLVGATQLALNLLSAVAAHVQRYPDDPSPGLFVSTGLFAFFLVEYLTFEEVHLYTYDFMAEKVGFKLGWGCLTFYPFFYAVGAWSQAGKPNPHTPWWGLAGAVLLFFTGWALSRGANLQKFHFKRDPTRRFLGITPEAVGGRVLVNGFWGLSRHVNYLGEILMATGITLALGHPGSWEPWLYPLYYVALLFPRQHFDDLRCAEKYGPLWAEYVRRVPYRIVPYVY